MSDTTTQLQNFIESATQASTKAFELQSAFGQDYFSRIGQTNAQLAEGLKDYLASMSQAKSMTELVQNGMAYQQSIAAKAQEMAQENQGAWEKLQAELKSTYEDLAPKTA